MAIAPDSSGSTAVTAGATSATLDITSAAAGAWCYAWVAVGSSNAGSPSIAATGWTTVQGAADSTTAEYAVLRRQKQSGDTTFTVTWTTSAHAELAWASWTGVDGTTPDESSAIVTNGATSRTAVPTPTATPNAANRWAAGFFSARTSTSGNKNITWTPDAAQTERTDANNSAGASSVWFGNEIADTNAAVTQAAHSYTATHAPAAESHDGSAILFLIPAAAAAAGTLPQAARRTAARTPGLPAQRRFRLAPVPAQDGPAGETAQRRETWPRGMSRRGHVTLAVPPQLNPPYPPVETAQRRQAWPRGLPRRGRQASVTPPQANPPFPVAELRQWRQPRGSWPRRGHGFTPVPAQQAAAQAPAFAPQPLRHARIAAAALRRRPAPVPAAQDTPPQQPRRTRAVTPPPRRGRQAAPAHGQHAPPPQRPPARPRWPLARRGRVTWPAQAQVAAPPPAWVQSHRSPLRAIALICRRFRQLLPWPQAAQPAQPAFTIGALTAGDQPGSALTAAGAASALTASTAASGTLTAATTTTGGPS